MPSTKAEPTYRIEILEWIVDLLVDDAIDARLDGRPSDGSLWWDTSDALDKAHAGDLIDAPLCAWLWAWARLEARTAEVTARLMGKELAEGRSSEEVTRDLLAAAVVKIRSAISPRFDRTT